jgi:hypothetical protein
VEKLAPDECMVDSRWYVLNVPGVLKEDRMVFYGCANRFKLDVVEHSQNYWRMFVCGKWIFCFSVTGVPRFNSMHLQDAVQSHGCR